MCQQMHGACHSTTTSCPPPSSSEDASHRKHRGGHVRPRLKKRSRSSSSSASSSSSSSSSSNQRFISVTYIDSLVRVCLFVGEPHEWTSRYTIDCIGTFDDIGSMLHPKLLVVVSFCIRNCSEIVCDEEAGELGDGAPVGCSRV